MSARDLQWVGGEDPDGLVPRRPADEEKEFFDTLVPVQSAAVAWWWKVRKWRCTARWPIDPTFSITGSAIFEASVILDRGVATEQGVHLGFGEEMAAFLSTDPFTWAGSDFVDVTDCPDLYHGLGRLTATLRLFNDGYLLHGNDGAIPVGSMRPQVSLSVGLIHDSTEEGISTTDFLLNSSTTNPIVIGGTAKLKWGTPNVDYQFAVTGESTATEFLTGAPQVTIELPGVANTFFGYDGKFDTTTGVEL